MNDIEKKTETQPVKAGSLLNPFANTASFELAQRMVKPLASSDLVPNQFRGNTANCLIALNLANRMGADPFMVMQSVYVVHGKPAFSSSFLIGLINSSGMLRGNLRFEMIGDPKNDTFGCRCLGTNQDGELLIGPPVSIATAKAEGWYGKNGSKWPAMPELMLRYRAASFWSRVYAPELTLGIRSVEEAVDIVEGEIVENGLETLNTELRDKTIEAPAIQQDEGELVDSTGATFDPELHAMNDQGEPSLTKAGRFRKKRVAHKAHESQPQAPTETEPEAPEEKKMEPSRPERELDVDLNLFNPDQYSPTLKSMLMAVKGAEDHAAVERVSNHPFVKELSENEGAILVEACKARGAQIGEV